MSSIFRSALFVACGSVRASPKTANVSSLKGTWKLIGDKKVQITIKNHGSEAYLIKVLQNFASLQYLANYADGGGAGGSEGFTDSVLFSMVPRSQGWALLWYAENDKPSSISITRDLEAFVASKIKLRECALSITFQILRIAETDLKGGFPKNDDVVSIELKLEEDSN